MPQSGEKEHSWMVIDKHLLLQHPKDFWHEFRMTNNIPMVFGATAQGEVNFWKKRNLFLYYSRNLFLTFLGDCTKQGKD